MADRRSLSDIFNDDSTEAPKRSLDDIFADKQVEPTAGQLMNVEPTPKSDLPTGLQQLEGLAAANKDTWAVGKALEMLSSGANTAWRGGGEALTHPLEALQNTLPAAATGIAGLGDLVGNAAMQVASPAAHQINQWLGQPDTAKPLEMAAAVEKMLPRVRDESGQSVTPNFDASIGFLAGNMIPFGAAAKGATLPITIAKGAGIGAGFGAGSELAGEYQQGLPINPAAIAETAVAMGMIGGPASVVAHGIPGGKGGKNAAREVAPDALVGERVGPPTPSVEEMLMARLNRDEAMGYRAGTQEHGPPVPTDLPTIMQMMEQAAANRGRPLKELEALQSQPEGLQLTEAQAAERAAWVRTLAQMEDARLAEWMQNVPRTRERILSERQPIPEELTKVVDSGVGEALPGDGGPRIERPGRVAEPGAGEARLPRPNEAIDTNRPRLDDGAVPDLRIPKGDAGQARPEAGQDATSAPERSPKARPDAGSNDMGAVDGVPAKPGQAYGRQEEFPRAGDQIPSFFREVSERGIYGADKDSGRGGKRANVKMQPGEPIHPQSEATTTELRDLRATIKKQKPGNSKDAAKDKKGMLETIDQELARRAAIESEGGVKDWPLEADFDPETMPLTQLRDYADGPAIEKLAPQEQTRIMDVLLRRAENEHELVEPDKPLRAKIDYDVPEGYPVSESHQGFAGGREYFWKGKGKDRQLYSAPIEAVFDEAGFRKGARREASKKIAQEFRDEPGYAKQAKARLDKQRATGKLEREYTPEATSWLERAGKALRDFADDEQGMAHESLALPDNAEELVVKAVGAVARWKQQSGAKGKVAKAIEDTGRQIFGLQNDLDIIKRYDPEFWGSMIYRLGEAESMQRKAPVAGSLEERAAFAEVFDRRNDLQGLDRQEMMAELSDIKDLTPQQKQFALNTIEWVNAVTRDIAERRRSLREESGDFKGSKYDKFLGGLNDYWSGVGKRTGLETGLNHVKTGMYDALVTGNWGVHGIHLYEAGIHGFAYTGAKNMFKALLSGLKDKRVQQFIKDYQGGAGYMKKMRFGHDLTFIEKKLLAAKRLTPELIKGNIGTKLLFGAGKIAEGGWLEGVKLGILRAAMLEKVAKDMGYKSAGDLAEVLMKEPVGEAATDTALQAYGRITYGLSEMTGYTPGMFKNRNAMKRFGGGWLDVFAPFMGMRQVQSRFIYNMWAKSLNEVARTKNPLALAPVVWTHGLLLAAGGAATVPRVLKRLIIAQLGASTWQSISDNLDEWRQTGVALTGGSLGWADPREGLVEHLQWDMIPYLMTSLDGFDSLKKTLGNIQEKQMGDKDWLAGWSLALGAGSIGGLPSFRNMAFAKELWDEAQAGQHDEHAFEDESLPEIATRKGFKPAYREKVTIDFDNFKAAMKFFTPWKLSVEDHHKVDQLRYVGRLRDELNAGKNTSIEAVNKWIDAKYPEYSDGIKQDIADELGDIRDLKDVDWEDYLTDDDGNLPKQLQEALPNNYTEQEFERAAIKYQLGRWQSEFTREVHDAEEESAETGADSSGSSSGH